MSSTLEPDYGEFKFSRENQLEASNVEENLQNFSDDSLDVIQELLRCDICDQKFQAKKDLQTHIIIHHVQPRVVLKRIANLKTRKEKDDQYWLNSERKGNLKITIKRQSPVDCLKLKLKKSPISEDFTVVSNFDLDKEESSEQKDALAEIQEDDRSNSEEEKTAEESFENVMINQENNYEEDNFESEPDNNPLESSERPLMDNIERDSGVGSDSVQALEREDQHEDDVHADNNSNSDHALLGENEDPVESDALEATCRETIENLRRLGEQSRYIGSRSTEHLNAPDAPTTPAEEEQTEEPEEEEEEEEENDTPNMIQELRANSEISIVPKSALMPEQPTSTSPRGAETEIVPVSRSSSSSFSWNKVTAAEDSNSSKAAEDSSEKEKDIQEGTETTGSLLQSFLLEQQRNQNESNLSNAAQSFETEYVSLERLAETVNTCRVCNEKFKDIAHLDAHRAKAGHYQCNIPDCSGLVFTTPLEVSVHKTQAHGAPPPVSPNLSSVSPHRLSQNSPHAHSPHLNRTSPHVNTHSPHSPSIQHAAQNSPTFPGQVPVAYPPVNLDQLPAPVQQLAQQVQRMPLPQPQLPPGLPGANPMMPGANYYPQPPGRPPMYRVQAPIHYPPSHLAQMYQQYSSYQQQMGMQPQMQPQIPQQGPRARYPGVPGPRTGRMPQPPVSVQSIVPRQRMKRPALQPTQMSSQIPSQMQQQGPPQKQRRMDVLIPDRNEDADCHVIAQQKRNDGLPVIQNVQGGTSVQSTKNDSTIHLTDSITLSVRQPGHNPAQVNAMVQNTKKPDASTVANVLAARGITVTPAVNNKKTVEPSQVQQPLQQSPTQPQQKQLNVTSLNLNSAISIIPTPQRKQQDQQQGQFAVPQNKQQQQQQQQNKQVTNEVERPPRPPTVDLTQDVPTPITPVVRRGRPPRMIQSLTCQVCDKRFQSQELLTQHMATHRTTNKLLHKCNLCPAQYPTAPALATHKKTYHKEVDTTPQQNGTVELAIPVVDLKSPNTLSRLSNLGIQSYIPLSQLSAQTGGYFALPIVTIDNARNSNSCNLGALAATSILSLGPLRYLPNR